MENFSFYQVTVYLGILGFLCMSFSFLSGMRFIKPKPKYKLHKRIGYYWFYSYCHSWLYHVVFYPFCLTLNV